jgi:hypothetical protein
MRIARKRAAALPVALLAIAVLPGSALPDSRQAAGGAKFFHSPSGNIQCELDWQRGSGIADAAYCQTFKPARSVTLSPSGALRLCTGTHCLGNGPENAFTLQFGHATRLGPFRCLSQAAGMRCTVASGHGFVLSRSGVHRLP